MATTTALRQASIPSVVMPSRFLNAYKLILPSTPPWRVSLYSADPVEGAAAGHEERGSLKNAAWAFRNANKALCPGPHYFAIDVSPNTVAIPTAWQIPIGAEAGGYRFVPINDISVNPDDPEHDTIVRGLIREGFKRAFKSSANGPLGQLWQNFNDFCQVPVSGADGEVLFCRQIGADVVRLKGRCWCVQIRLSTQTVDGHSFADYMEPNDVKTLAEWITLKRKNRLTRQNRPTDVAVLRVQRIVGGDGFTAERLELHDPDAVVEMCRSVGQGNRRAWPQTVTCKSFGKPCVEVAPEQLRLILDTQITLEDHRETIIDPDERARVWGHVRDLLDGSDVLGATIGVDSVPVDVATFPGGLIGPPAIRVRDAQGEGVIPAPDHIDEASLRRRGRDRSEIIKKFGLLQQRPLNPLLACPADRFNRARADRMLYDLNTILDEQRLPFRFSQYELYRDVQSIEKAVATGAFDSVLVVLPEGKMRAQTTQSTHEQVKRKLVVSSQCIQYDNTFYNKLGEYPVPSDKAPRDSELPRRIRDSYINCIWGLAVKNHFVPFAPAEPFHYNVHVGIDAGGRDNNKAMVCIGYGFQKPRERLIFLAEELPVAGSKAEPIPVDAIVPGILAAFEKLAAGLGPAGRSFDLSRVLFLRDGAMLGDGERWNERDAFAPIMDEVKKRGWLGGEPLWTIAEVSKSAEGWRPVTRNGTIRNPLVGQWIAPFDNPNRVVLSTTGAPYLTQGTASPLLLQIEDCVASSKREDVLRDIVWEADMCFTKPDMGMKLPWVLYVANEGALQAAKSYEITGVPV